VSKAPSLSNSIELAGRRRLKEQSLRPPNERSVQISRTTLYKEIANDVGL
jgi:hypothetical protein